MSTNDGAGPSKTAEEQAIDDNNVSFWRLSQQLKEEDIHVEQHGGGEDEATGVGEDDTTTDCGNRTDG